MELKKIGLIGTGIMGGAMASHLMDAGYEVSVYNRTKAKADRLVEKGAKWCGTPRECAESQDVVISIVGYPKDVEEVYLGSQGILKGAKKGAYLIDMTTSSPALAERIFKEAEALGLHGMDAPVTGGDTGAKAGTLTILAGGRKEDFETVLPVFQAMGKNIRYMGPAGAGQKTKLCNQIAIAGALSGACEALTYAKACGLEVEQVLEAISSGAAGSFQLSNVAAKGAGGDWAPGFMLKHFIKDMKLSRESSDSCGVSLDVLKQVLKEAESLEEQGQGDAGTQTLLNYYWNWSE